MEVLRVESSARYADIGYGTSAQCTMKDARSWGTQLRLQIGFTQGGTWLSGGLDLGPGSRAEDLVPSSSLRMMVGETRSVLRHTR